MEIEMQHIFTRNGAGLVEQLIAKTQFWEQERNKIFYYDEVRPELQTELSDPKSFIPNLDFRTKSFIVHKYLDLKRYLPQTDLDGLNVL
jgi:hypothetical protein